MSYQEDVALVLEAMGYTDPFANSQVIQHGWVWDHKFPDVPRLQALDIDANFVVEQVIPWARRRGLVLTVFWIDPNPAAKVEEQEDPRFPSQWGQKPAFHEAVMAAIAAALRAGQ